MKVCACGLGMWLRTVCFRQKRFLVLTFALVSFLLIGYLLLNYDVTLTSSLRPSREARHVVFIKVHKASSTTVMKVLARYGLRHNLTFALPKSNRTNIISEYEPFHIKQIRPSTQAHYDMLFCHAIFRHSTIAPLFPPDTVYLAVLREPFAQFLSAFRFYRDVYPQRYLRNLTGTDALARYFRHRESVEPKMALYSFTNSRMSLDLGLAPSMLLNHSAIQAFVRDLDQQFHLVLLTEHMDESLVLLRRRLGWGLRDVLQTVANANHQGEPLKTTPGDRRRHRQLASADYALYDHFYSRFWREVAAEGPGFQREVLALREVRDAVEEFCGGRRSPGDRLKVGASPWSPEFFVEDFDCRIIGMGEMDLVLLLQTQFVETKPTVALPSQKKQP